MTCSGCSARVGKALDQIDGVKRAVVNLASEQATVDLAGRRADVAALVGAVEAAGYQATPLEADEIRLDDGAEARRQGWLLVLSGLLTLPLVGQMVGGWLGYGYSLDAWLQFALATPVQFYFGWRFYISGYKALRALSSNMDQLVALGTTAAYGYSAYFQWFPSI